MADISFDTCTCGSVVVSGAQAVAELKADNERLINLLNLYRDAVRIDATMEGPKFLGSNASALKRAWEADMAVFNGEEGRT